jgi:hypothetical protein
MLASNNHRSDTDKYRESLAIARIVMGSMEEDIDRLHEVINALAYATDLGFQPYIELIGDHIYRVYVEYAFRKGDYKDLELDEVANWLNTNTDKLMVERPELSRGLTDYPDLP